VILGGKDNDSYNKNASTQNEVERSAIFAGHASSKQKEVLHSFICIGKNKMFFMIIMFLYLFNEVKRLTEVF
jgi:hypothetical protein